MNSRGSKQIRCAIYTRVSTEQGLEQPPRWPSPRGGDMFEIRSSQLALSKQADEDTKPFAQKMVQDHQKTSSELKAVVEGSMVKLTLPATMDSEHQKMLNVHHRK